MNDPQGQPTHLWRILLKAGLLFVALNLLFALLDPINLLGQWSIYNRLVPGRVRLPYGEQPESYNLSLHSLSAMFASHEIEVTKTPDQYRVVLLGDSSTWGILLKPEETLAAQINAQDLTSADGRIIHTYNLGHPILALSKDLLILNEAMRYEPDMIVWLTTLHSFPRDTQLGAPLVQRNAAQIRDLFTAYDLDYPLDTSLSTNDDLLARSIVGRRRDLADWLRLQLYGVMWGITGIDQVYPESYEPRASDFEVDLSWTEYDSPQPLTEADLAFDILVAGHDIAGGMPILLVNEPIYVSDGENGDLRYNLWYPRWAYDGYRETYQAAATARNWHYLDLWDLVAPSEFTDSPVHLTQEGTQQLAKRLSSAILRIAEGTQNGG